MPASMLDYFNTAQFAYLSTQRYVPILNLWLSFLSTSSAVKFLTLWDQYSTTKSNDSELSPLFPWNQGSYIDLIVWNVV